MVRTAEDEWFGDSIDTAIAANYALRLPTGVPGAMRFYVLRPSGAGLSATFPNVLGQPDGVSVVVANHGSFTITLRSSDAALISTLPVGYACRLYLRDNTYGGGVGYWLATDSVSELGTALVHDRKSVDITLTESIRDGVNLRTTAFEQGHRSDVYPFAVRCTIAEGKSIGNITTNAGLDTGTWPTGSTIVITVGNNAAIQGVGGEGGRGGDESGAPPPQNGSPGGLALAIGANTVLFNHGAIRAGGGGGGGGSRRDPPPLFYNMPGAGGGGGAGFMPGDGGLSGVNTAGVSYPFQNGEFGHQAVGGLGGAQSSALYAGGNGGTNGAAGGNGNAIGGAAGNAIERAAAFSLTKVIAGTITGAEVVV